MAYVGRWATMVLMVYVGRWATVVLYVGMLVGGLQWCCMLVCWWVGYNGVVCWYVGRWATMVWC